MRLPQSLIVLFLSILLTSCASKSSKPIRTIELPADDAYINGQYIQWWYWNGNLTAENGQRFGFQMVFFSIRPNLLMAHASVTDITNKAFHYETVTRLMIPKRSADRFHLAAGSIKPLTAKGGGGVDRIAAVVGDFSYDLLLRASKPPLFHYGGRSHEYEIGGYTYYYSRPKMEVDGHIVVDGVKLNATGEAWFDRQYGDLEEIIDTGWQWFSIRLSDNTQMALFYFEEPKALSETLLVKYGAGGNTTIYAPDKFELKVLDYWHSSESGCNYPINWQLEVDDQILTIVPYLKDQEVRPKAGAWLTPIYWEGAASVAGQVGGEAYVELHGFCGNSVE
ncbi:MAG: carotenoid 1,2-hydratase [Candidatus Thiodiazotropha lotti]|nr:carotenoid 1,2-hydratase [Candidatus Thiodiazotropha lotti]MCG7998062.1 carotenoid 1,2-hydratase [Candidatus Thiodiazotropha lotti]MCW4185083.1 carotenoid 1,2-hydratase [Candidatus Thiodiazotropha weberae]MCW4189826.1 carotenoid 1,2-hydratase [Candidatus Thiodiazotropha weberae]